MDAAVAIRRPSSKTSSKSKGGWFGRPIWTLWCCENDDFRVSSAHVTHVFSTEHNGAIAQSAWSVDGLIVRLGEDSEWCIHNQKVFIDTELRPPTCHRGAIAASSTMPFMAHLRSKGHKRECDGGLRRTADAYGATVGVVHSGSCDQTD